MNTKTCKRCGWVYPITQPGTRCRICGEPFEQITCRLCRNSYDKSDIAYQNVCKKCHNALNVDIARRRRQEMVDRFDQWLDKVKQVPKNYPVITEAQWLEACSFFDGCARCASDEIDTRGFFVGRELGGRYCDWNVIPLCTRCAKMWRLDKSMFRYAYFKDTKKNDKHYRPLGVTDSTTEFRDSIEKIVRYLEVKLDNAIRTSTDTPGSTEGSEQNNTERSGS